MVLSLAPWFVSLEVPAGHSIVVQGGTDRDFYVCLSGRATITRGGVEVEHIDAGAWFGELALILGTPRAASVVAATSMRLARLSRDAYGELAQRDPALGLHLLEALLQGVAARLHDMSDSVRSLLRDRALPRHAEIAVRVQGHAASQTVRTGTRAAELLPREVDGHPVVAALIDRKPVALHTALTSGCELGALTTAHWEGQRIYRQSLALLALDAARSVEPSAEIELAHSVGFARRIRVHGATLDLDELARCVETELTALAQRGLTLLEELWSVDEAREYFARLGSVHSVALLRSWREAAVPLVSYGGRYALRTGPLVSDTSLLSRFGVVADTEGLLLLYGSHGAAAPTRRMERNPATGSERPGTMASEARDVSRQARTLVGTQEPWQRALGISSIGAYNRACIEGNVPQLIRVNEGFHEKFISRIADQIVAPEAAKRIVCVAGPSSSGKTTFIKRLKVQLHVNGRNPIGISLDDYYCDREHTPRDEAGDLDYEALHALRLPLLHEHLARLLAGETVRTASYDFATGSSRPQGGPTIMLRDDDLLMLEGIHGLNPEILGDAGKGKAFLVFVCPLAQLPLDDVTRVHASDLRLLRRIVRDRHSRATDAESNILRWPSVRRGERAHIFPFQHMADAVFDSGLLYELSVLKVFAERYLLEVPQSSRAYTTAFRLLGLLDRVVTIYPDHVPQTSLLREFIGGSGFDA